MPLILICSSFAPLAVVAFFPFFCRFFADFRPFSALLRVRVFSRVFALFFVFMQNNFCIFCICKICICILRLCKIMQNLHLHTFLLKFFAGLLRTNELQKRKMVYIPQCAAGVLSVRKCAKLIGIAPYSVSRLKARYRQFGAAIFIHGNTGRAPKNKKYDSAKIAADYANFTGSPFAAFRDDCEVFLGYSPSYSTVYNALSGAGIMSPRARVPVREKKKHLPRDERPNEGDLIQIDGCSHDWFMNGHKITLHGAIDDATHKVVALYFCANECLLGYYQLLFQIFTRTGGRLPRAIYSDRSACFFVNRGATLEEQLAGAEIKNIEWSINGVYFYTADLPADGDHLDLFDFVKKDGTRYDYFSVKPIELKAKCSKGRYSVKFDDIPFDFGAVLPVVDEYKSDTAVYSWTSDYEIKTNNADGAGVTAAVVLGYKLDDKATSTEIIARDVELRDYLRRFFMRKTSAELSPTNEDKLQVEIKNGINDFILSSSKIRAVKFQSLDIKPN